MITVVPEPVTVEAKAAALDVFQVVVPLVLSERSQKPSTMIPSAPSVRLWEARIIWCDVPVSVWFWSVVNERLVPLSELSCTAEWIVSETFQFDITSPLSATCEEKPVTTPLTSVVTEVPIESTWVVLLAEDVVVREESTAMPLWFSRLPVVREPE